MSFKTDKQTIDDLKIFGRRNDSSVYGIFNRTSTRGGAQILEEMFMNPMDSIERIVERTAILKYFKENKFEFPFRSELFDAAEFYLGNTDLRTQLVSSEITLKRKFNNALGADTEFAQLHKGIISLIEIIDKASDFVSKNNNVNEHYKKDLDIINQIANMPEFEKCKADAKLKKISFEKAAEYDKLFRFTLHKELKKLLHYIYCLDCYISISRVAIERGFEFAVALPPEDNILEFENVYHPLLKNAVGNDLKIDSTNNMIFLTGANMAGKSTFMKSYCIAIYLAHCGFPVPAKSMRYSVRNGMYTTINLPDNLNSGISHFYAEVLRVKHVATEIVNTDNLVIVFDELFRGTNVKDAYDATVAVMEAFASNPCSTYMVSTHIVEAGEKLAELCNNINFLYLPTVMKGAVPTYPYTLAKGITEDRHGMVIIRNEGILDILNSDN